MTLVTVTLQEHEARALAFSSDLGDMLITRAGCASPFPPGGSPREIAVQKLVHALEYRELEVSL